MLQYTNDFKDDELDAAWSEVMRSEFSKNYFHDLLQFLNEEAQRGKIIYPHPKDMFNAFKLTPLSKVKVVILGQDPYHGLGQAHGLSFSVRPGQAIPPSLKNIYKELTRDLKIPPANHGHLVRWAEQGVLLLNTVLTVEAHQAGSHQDKGWEQFTDQVIKTLDEKKQNLVFLLWGAHAQKKASKLSSNRHCLLKAPHPSPLSAHRGFIGCSHFSKANEYLIDQGLGPIDWNVSSSLDVSH